MSLSENENSTYSLEPQDNSGFQSLSQLLSSRDWSNYFKSLSGTVDFKFLIYDENGSRIFATEEHPLCELLKSSHADNQTCSETCDTHMFESLSSDGPQIYKCHARLTSFVFPVERSGERAYIVGRGNFALYDDFIDFLKIIKENNIPGIPVTMPFSFPGEDYIKAIARYVHLNVNRLLNSVEDRFKLEEKLLRMTTLFDSQTFGTLSKNPELMYRYILDTIEFVFGSTSVSLMLLDEESSKYRTVYSIGRYKDAVMDFFLEKESPVVYDMSASRSALFHTEPEKIAPSGPLKEMKSVYFFPIFVSGTIEVIIAFFDRDFSRQDIKIMNAFKDYVQLNLENRNLRVSVNKSRKADEKIAYMMDLSSSITSVLDKETLLHMLLDKSLQLLNAEQGSLMLLDQDTSELVVEARKSADDTVREKMRFKKDEGISGMVLENGGAFVVEDIEKDPRIRQSNRPRYRTRSFMSVPIKIEDRLTGVLNISDKARGDAFNKEDLGLIESFISSAAIAIERSILFSQTEDLRKLSITDHLTGIYNRRYLNRRLSEEITRYNRYKHPFSFMMLDLDKFKEYNDTYGHISGDNLIKLMASIIEKSLRTIDIAARFGGDEFVAIFPQTPKVDAIQITNRLKEKIDKSLTEHKIEIALTVSIGLATYPDDASSIMELIEKTDQALYLAKKGGGNRVVYL